MKNPAAESADTAARQAQALSTLYQGLAEALGADTQLPTWLARPGKDWPLWEPASQMAAQMNWPSLQQAVNALAGVNAASPKKRLSAFHALQHENGRPPLWLYESQHLNGRFLGPQTFELQSLYRQAGLEIAGAELADHAALELAFLAFLSEREALFPQPRPWRQARLMFLLQHARKWLPDVGVQLAASKDPAWKAAGLLLIALLNPPGRNKHPSRRVGLPTLSNQLTCTLCGFCAQVCPTHALAMHEDANNTRLMLLSGACIHCQKCVRVCEENALTMEGPPSAIASIVLRESPRALCPRCGSPTVSQAELKAVTDRLGEHPAWLDYCLNCR